VSGKRKFGGESYISENEDINHEFLTQYLTEATLATTLASRLGVVRNYQLK
jgi:hypothetical protein